MQTTQPSSCGVPKSPPGELLKLSLFMLEWGTQLPPVGAGKPAIISIYALGNNAGQFEDVNRHGSNYHSNVGCD